VQAGLRNQLELLTDLLAERSTGVLITLDEIHQNQLAELRELATTCSTRSARAASSPSSARAGASVSDVVNDDVLTFLRRAERHSLGSVARADVERGFREPNRVRGASHRRQPALQVMVDGAAGYPFLLQLVGAQTWRLHPEEEEFTSVDALEGVARARRRLGSLVHEPALSAASEHRHFVLLAMVAMTALPRWPTSSVASA